MSKKMFAKVKSLQALKKIIASGKTEFFISLNGCMRSSKTINYIYDKNSSWFDIHHHIDDSDEKLTEPQLLKTNIGKALEKGSFYSYGF